MIRTLLFFVLLSVHLHAQEVRFPWVADGVLGHLEPVSLRFTPAATAQLDYPNPATSSAVLQAFQENMMYGFKNKAGETVIKAGYEAVGHFRDGFTWVKLDYKRYYYIDEQEQPLLNYTFDRAYDFSEGLARVLDKNAKRDYAGYGYIDTTGQIAIALQYRHAGDFVGGYALVQNQEQEWQIIDTNANIIARCRGLARLRSGYYAIGKEQ